MAAFFKKYLNTHMISSTNEQAKTESIFMKLVWHIDRAKFEFSDPAEIDTWETNPVVNFEFSPAESDDGGESVFVDADAASNYFALDADNSKYTYAREGDHLVVSAWVRVDVEVTEEFDEEMLDEWASENGGWASCSIDLGEDVDAFISEDDGGDWRIE